MVDLKKTDQDIANLTKQLKRLEAKREKEAEKAAAVKRLVKDLKADLRANKLTVDDLLEALGGVSSPAGKAKSPGKRRRKVKAATRKARKSTAARITIPDLGTYQVASRGRLPAEVAAFVEKSGLSRAELIERYKD